jgi:4-oxalocrotonate tautomerase
VFPLPHVIVKLWPGRSDAQKQALTERIAAAMIETIGCPDSSISIAFEEVPQDRWTAEVYKPEILAKEALLTKKPGYRPDDTEQ